MSAEGTAIDQSILESIRSLQSPEGEDLVARIVRNYIVESARLIGRIADAVRNSDGEGVRAGAHSLKSCSGNVGARKVVELSRRLEMDGRNGALQDSGNALSALQVELTRAVSELERLSCVT